MTTRDERFMSRALALAERGRGHVEPNPPVGAVIVQSPTEDAGQSQATPERQGQGPQQEQVLAEGWHEHFGGPHAEAAALEAARRRGRNLRGATVYVTLEPCCPFAGKKTPACSDALAAAGVGRVVVAMADPDPNVSGRGIARLREAGIQVDVGTGQAEARELLAGYVKLRTQRRPWVICKWAQTSDGFLALPDRRWVTGAAARRRVHEVRAQCDGILVGIETVLADDPLLTSRSAGGRQSGRSRDRSYGRVVLDSRLRLPVDSQVVRTAREVPVLVATTPNDQPETARRAEELQAAGLEVLELPGSADGVNVEALLDELGRRQWTYLLVEGGPTVLRSFVAGGHADELQVFVSPDAVGEGFDLPRPYGRTTRMSRPPGRFDVGQLACVARLTPTVERLGRDELRRYRLRNGT